MARLIRAKVANDSGKTLSEILEANVVKEKRGALTGYVCAPVNSLLVAAMNKKKGIVVDECTLFTVPNAEENLSVLHSKDFGAAMGYGDVVSEKLKKFGVEVPKNFFTVACAMDVNVEFKNKAEIASLPKHTIEKFMTYIHTKNIKLAENGTVRIPTKDGSVILYMPQNPKHIREAYRRELLKMKYKTQDVEVCVPQVGMDSGIDLAKYCKVKAHDTVDGNSLSLDSYLLSSLFEMDAEGARVRQKAVVRLTKSKPIPKKVIKFDRPFVVIVERNGIELFSAAINKKDWVKA